MLVCWEWLSEYVDLNVDADVLADRFAMTGLNHESTETVGNDVVIDLEVTSNRGDCLGHIGVAREAAVILKGELRIPNPQPVASIEKVSEHIAVVNQAPELCPRYTARVVRGVKVGPSPEWLTRRLAAIGIASINNIVDVTNYVMMECGQPLHAFDLQQLRGGQINVRAARDKETLVAIDHRTYQLDSKMIVIADAERAVAIGGVMGGADSEVTEQTRDVLIEAAAFEPLAVRRAARLLKLQSPSSFRFERRPDASGIDWASRRCCELIYQVAGGELCQGVVDVGVAPRQGQSIELRQAQIARVLGIDIPLTEVERILTALGCRVDRAPTSARQASQPDQASQWGILQVVPPSWRGDVTREIDLIEEVARIFGYEQIPENVSVPLHVAEIRPKDIAMARVRHTLSAYGIDEAMTASVVPDSFEEFGSPWTDQPPLATETALLVGSRTLRRSLIPSLLAARYTNQTQSIRNAQLYEAASLYLAGATAAELPTQIAALALVTQGDLQVVKGMVEEIIAQVAGHAAQPVWQASEHALFAAGSLQRVLLGDRLLGYVGLISRQVQDAMSLEHPVAAAELSVDALTTELEPVRRTSRVSLFPAITRDLNFVVDEPVRWNTFRDVCHTAASDLLQDVRYQETYRDIKKDGAGKKRLLLSLHFQSLDRTLTGEEVDAEVTSIIAACEKQCAAKLLR
ncbi:MAG: phenylalanine--tRNA ligase subunit beta [Pirellulaceae bacterium]|jgi:phenylalanyl-tRNA synthetase beta chain